jgi:hypothetical protein
MSWRNFIVLAPAILLSLGIVFSWWLDWRLYRSTVLLALRRSAWAAFHSQQVLGWSVVSSVFLGAMAFFEWWTHYPPVILIFAVAVVLCGTYLAVRPAAVIVLGSSLSPEARKIVTVVREACSGYRVVYFLVPLGAFRHVDDSIAGAVERTDENFDNWYQLDGEMWKYIVYPMLRLVPVIVVITWNRSPGLDEEFVFLSRTPELCKKVIVCGDDSEEDILAKYGVRLRVVKNALELQRAVMMALRSQMQE